jgi:hypothetical protein
MAASKPKPPPHSTSADTTAAVDAFMSELVHPYKSEVQAIRQSILRASSAITEGVKWKAPSFRTHEYFATVNLREKEGVSIILHLGAKVRGVGLSGLVIDDPTKLLKWLAPDRAIIRFTSQDDFESKETAFSELIRSWITHV